MSLPGKSRSSGKSGSDCVTLIIYIAWASTYTLSYAIMKLRDAATTVLFSL